MSVGGRFPTRHSTSQCQQLLRLAILPHAHCATNKTLTQAHIYRHGRNTGRLPCAPRSYKKSRKRQPRKSNTKFPHKTASFLGVTGLTGSSYIEHDCTTSGPAEYVCTVYMYCMYGIHVQYTCTVCTVYMYCMYGIHV